MAFGYRWLFCQIVVSVHVVPNKHWLDAFEFVLEWQPFLRGQRSSFGGTTFRIIWHYCLSVSLYYFHSALLWYVFIPVLDGVRPCGRVRKPCHGIGVLAPLFLFLLKDDFMRYFLRCIFTFLVNVVFGEFTRRLYQGNFCADAVRSCVKAWCCQIVVTRLFLIDLFEAEKGVIFTWLFHLLATASLLCQALATSLRVRIQVNIERAVMFIDAGHWRCYHGVLLQGL